jgi:rubrerythrin
MVNNGQKLKEVEISLRPSDKKLEKAFLETIRKRLLQCGRCNYVWIQKNMSKLPQHCPSCASPYFNKARKIQK